MYCPLCIFLDSRDNERLLVDHPFYLFVKDIIRHVVQSTPILRYMMKTLQNDPLSDELVAEERKIQGIHYPP